MAPAGGPIVWALAAATRQEIGAPAAATAAPAATVSSGAPPTPAPAAALPQPAASGPAKGTATVIQLVNIRNAPSTAGPIVAQYTAGMTFNYDSYVDANGYRWLSYVSTSKVRRYVAQQTLDGKIVYVKGGVPLGSVPSPTPTPTPTPSPTPTPTPTAGAMDTKTAAFVSAYNGQVWGRAFYQTPAAGKEYHQGPYTDPKYLTNITSDMVGECVSLVTQFLKYSFGIDTPKANNADARSFVPGGAGGIMMASYKFPDGTTPEFKWHGPSDRSWQNGDILVFSSNHIGIYYNGKLFDQNDSMGGRGGVPGVPGPESWPARRAGLVPISDVMRVNTYAGYWRANYTLNGTIYPNIKDTTACSLGGNKKGCAVDQITASVISPISGTSKKSANGQRWVAIPAPIGQGKVTVQITAHITNPNKWVTFTTGPFDPVNSTSYYW